MIIIDYRRILSSYIIIIDHQHSLSSQIIIIYDRMKPNQNQVYTTQLGNQHNSNQTATNQTNMHQIKLNQIRTSQVKSPLLTLLSYRLPTVSPLMPQPRIPQQ